MLDHLMPLISSPWLYVIVFAAVAIDGFLPVVPSEARDLPGPAGRRDLRPLAAAGRGLRHGDRHRPRRCLHVR
jgi:hypothetical protein